jgi:hypothetical protein
MQALLYSDQIIFIAVGFNQWNTNSQTKGFSQNPVEEFWAKARMPYYFSPLVKTNGNE